MSNKKSNERVIFEIISYGGSAKGMAYEAITAAQEGDFEKAKGLLKEADEALVHAHRVQTEMIQAEARGDKHEVSMLFVHAQDHLMTAMEVRTLADTFLALLKRINALENK